MEKQGMDRRKRILRTGLLRACRLILLLAVLLPGSLLFSQQPGEPADPMPGSDGSPPADESNTPAGTVQGETAGKETPEGEASREKTPMPLAVQVEISPGNPAVNSPWTLSILVNHPNPREVNIKPPRFPSFLVLERVRTERRLVQEQQWTRVEFLFTPLRVGVVTLEPFEINIPGQQTVTETINARFREETRTARRYNPRFRWVGQTPSVPAGEKGELFLELSNWDPSKDVPSLLFRGRAPRNAILEEKLPAAAEEGIYRYTISIIPLEESSVTLEPFSLNSELSTLSIPGITIPVLPAVSPIVNKTASLSHGGADPDEGSASSSMNEIPWEGIPVRPFPVNENREKVFFLLSDEYNRICAGVRSLWENKRRAEALAEIRRNERDSLSGPFLVSLRREMEQALSLGFTEDERWRPLKISLPAWMILGIFVFSMGMLLFIFRHRLKIRQRALGLRQWVLRVRRNGDPESNVPAKNVTSRYRSGFRNVVIVILSIGVALIFLEEGVGNFFASRLSSIEKTAVLERTSAYRVPDLKGAVNAHFGEGQPVIVGAYHSDWCYAESPDGRSGWVKREAVINY